MVALYTNHAKVTNCYESSVWLPLCIGLNYPDFKKFHSRESYREIKMADATEGINVLPACAEHIKQYCFDKYTFPITSPRGRLLLINNQDFDIPEQPEQKSLKDREGSEKDCQKLEELFKQLDFVVNVQENASSRYMMELLDKEIRLEEQKQYGMFCLIILSHGDRLCIYGSDGRPVHYENIYKRLSARSFRAMSGKPKLLIIQACSGSQSEKSVTTDSCDVEDEVGELTAVPAPMRRVTRPQSAQLSPNSDMFVVRSSCPGYVSLLDPTKGSFLVRAFVEIMQKYSSHDALDSIINKARSVVREKCEEDKKTFQQFGHQTIFHSSTFTKSLYFFPGYDPTKPIHEQPSTQQRKTSTQPDEPSTLQPEPSTAQQKSAVKPENPADIMANAQKTQLEQTRSPEEEEEEYDSEELDGEEIHEQVDEYDSEDIDGEEIRAQMERYDSEDFDAEERVQTQELYGDEMSCRQS